ncbi:MAG: cyclic peptide export ABC transporter [Alcaligenaceae bacterium]
MRNPIKSELLDFLTDSNPQQLRHLVALSGLVGILNTLLIAVINMAASNVAKNESVTLEFFGYALVFIVFLFSTKRANKENIKKANEFIYRFKIRIMHDVFRSNLYKVDKLGRDYILEVLNRDTELVSQSVSSVLGLFQSSLTVFFLMIYMATVSVTASIILTGAIALVFIVGVAELNKLVEAFRLLAIEEAKVNALYGSFLSGYKEVKMNSQRALGLTRDLIADAKDVNAEKTVLLQGIVQYFMYLQMLMYLVVGLIIFVVPIFSADFSSQVLMVTTTALFLASSVSAAIVVVPNLSIANIAARNLRELSEKLSFESNDRTSAGLTEFSEVNTLALEDITYVHSGDGVSRPFALGPISFEFQAGKVYFIRGNNGSGKTTLIRVMLGLYQCQSGRLLVNGQPVAEPSNAAYRDLFAVVFSDFYLFKKLYGLPAADEAELNDLLDLFQMQHKVSIDDGVFSDLNFSTGQRKRLALLVALLEKKKIIVLDEWAADQDPEFRQEFYEQIIPKLRELGKTVIAITHDDQYYELADQVIYMENGMSIHAKHKD